MTAAPPPPGQKKPCLAQKRIKTMRRPSSLSMTHHKKNPASLRRGLRQAATLARQAARVCKKNPASLRRGLRRAPRRAAGSTRGQKKPCLAQKRIKTGVAGPGRRDGYRKKNPASLRRGLRRAGRRLRRHSHSRKKNPASLRRGLRPTTPPR